MKKIHFLQCALFRLCQKQSVDPRCLLVKFSLQTFSLTALTYWAPKKRTMVVEWRCVVVCLFLLLLVSTSYLYIAFPAALARGGREGGSLHVAEGRREQQCWKKGGTRPDIRRGGGGGGGGGGAAAVMITHTHTPPPAEEGKGGICQCFGRYYRKRPPMPNNDLKMMSL